MQWQSPLGLKGSIADISFLSYTHKHPHLLSAVVRSLRSVLYHTLNITLPVLPTFRSRSQNPDSSRGYTIFMTSPMCSFCAAGLRPYRFTATTATRLYSFPPFLNRTWQTRTAFAVPFYYTASQRYLSSTPSLSTSMPFIRSCSSLVSLFVRVRSKLR